MSVASEKKLLGHRQSVQGVDFSPDGHTLAFTDFVDSAILWDVNVDPNLPRSVTLAGKGNPRVESLAFVSGGTVLAAGDEEGLISLWDIASKQRIGNALEHHAHSGNALRRSVDALALSPSGKILASGSEDASIILWDLDSAAPIGKRLVGHSSDVTSLSFSPDGRLLASGSFDGRVLLWDVASRSVTATLTEKELQVTCLSFSPDGQILATNAPHKGIMLWDTRSGLQIGSRLEGVAEQVWSVAFSPDGRRLAAGTYDGNVVMWDLSRGQMSTLPKRHENLDGNVRHLVFSPVGDIFASGSWDHTIQLWDSFSQQPLGEKIRGHDDSVYSLAFSPDGKTLASGARDGALILWDTDPLSWVSHASRMANRSLTEDERRRFSVSASSNNGTSVGFSNQGYDLRPALHVSYDFLVASHWLFLVIWVVYWLCLVSWSELRFLLRQGAWVSLMLLWVFGSIVWGCCTGPLWRISNLSLPSAIEKFIISNALIGLAFACGKLQEYFSSR